MVYQYYFKSRRNSVTDMPSNPTHVELYKKPAYSNQFDCEVWGCVEYDRPIQQQDILAFDMFEATGTDMDRLKYLRKE